MIEAFNHRFVEYIPKELDVGMLYVSLEHAVAVHLCACGCGRKVVTPLSPINWQLLFDGRTVSLTPSIGNHAFACRSHYWIKGNRVQWLRAMAPGEVEHVRAKDRQRRERFYGHGTSDHPRKTASPVPQALKPDVAEVEVVPFWRARLRQLSASLATRLKGWL